MKIDRAWVAAYTFPTDQTESDGASEWTSTTLIAVEIEAQGKKGFGYTYTHSAAARLINDLFFPLLLGGDPMAIGKHWSSMNNAIRTFGSSGFSSSAISAIDSALWDLKARCLDLSMMDLLGATRDRVPVHGSGGFTSLTFEQLQRQLSDWIESGVTRVKMKVGREPNRDEERVRRARKAIGPHAELYIDASGAYSSKQALAFAEAFALQNVTWFEEPVKADDLDGLRFLRDRAPAGMNVVTGEYGSDSRYFHRMLEKGAVDILQADASRCGGLTGFVKAAVLCEAHGMPLAPHAAPTLHLALSCAMDSVVSIEHFFDHVRIESRFFDGFVRPKNGELIPDKSRAGFGIVFKKQDARKFLVPGSEAERKLEGKPSSQPRNRHQRQPAVPASH